MNLNFLMNKLCVKFYMEWTSSNVTQCIYLVQIDWLVHVLISLCFGLVHGKLSPLSPLLPSLPPSLSLWIIFDKFILCCLFRKSCYSHPVEVPEPLAKPWHCQEGGLAGHGTTPGPTRASRKEGQNHYPLFR